MSVEKWSYHVMPGFLVRENQMQLEVKNPQTDNWEDQSNNRELWHMLRDGTVVSEKEANDTYEYFKQRIRP